MKKNKKESENYLERCPQRNPDFTWSEDENNVVTIHIENKGFFNSAAQKLLKKPKVSHVHLDEMGSFVWPLIDGKKTICEIGEAVEVHFGEKAHPLYERLAQYFRILESYKFITWNKK